MLKSRLRTACSTARFACSYVGVIYDTLTKQMMRCECIMIRSNSGLAFLALSRRTTNHGNQGKKSAGLERDRSD